MTFFRNSWFIGIITGIVSGIFVNFITSRFLNSKEKREYFFHIKDANKEVVETLKPYIAEQGLPEFDIMIALILSTARRHNVDYKDLYKPTQYCDEIIGEVIRDVYVSSEKKKEYSEAVIKYKRLIKSKQTNEELDEELKTTNNMAKQHDAKKEYLTSSLTVVFGILCGVLTAIGNADSFTEIRNIKLLKGILIGDAFYIVGFFVVGVMFFLAMYIFLDVIKDEVRERRKKQRIQKRLKEDNFQ